MRRFQHCLILTAMSLSLTNCGKPIPNPSGYTLTVAPTPLYATKASVTGFGEPRVFTTLKEGGVIINHRKTAIELRMPASTNFKPNSSVVNPMLMALLDDVQEFMLTHPYSFATAHGYADNTMTTHLNQALSERRALAVTAYLESQGVLSKRLRITTDPSSAAPTANTIHEQDKRENRRLEISLTRN